MANIIEVKNLSKTFEVKTKEEGFTGSLKSIMKPQKKVIEAVSDIAFSVEEGEMLAFIGPNGAGKSTTIKMMTGILQPSAGQMKVLGYEPMHDRKKLSYHIGTVFGQKSQLWFHLPPADSFALLAKIYEIPNQQYLKKRDELKEIFEIQELMDIPVRKMSLGQRIRCEIAASMLHSPKIIFLDEPTIGLDVIVKQNIRKLIKDINQEHKTTIFLTSHDAGDIEELCKRVIVINHGQIVLDEPTKQLKYNYLNNKIISIKYAQEVNIQETDMTILKQKGFGVKVMVDSSETDIENVIHRLMKYGKVLDITIEDPPMEEIISKIYQSRGQRE